MRTMTEKLSFLNSYCEVRSCQRDEEKGRLPKIQTKVRSSSPIFSVISKGRCRIKARRGKGFLCKHSTLTLTEKALCASLKLCRYY